MARRGGRLHSGRASMRYLALLRGVNVGGVALRMDELRTMLLGLGLEKVETYIQSGNAIFESPTRKTSALEAEIGLAIERDKKLGIRVIVKTAADIARITASHPFDTGENGKALYVTILAAEVDSTLLSELPGNKGGSERFAGAGDVVYGLYGDGYGRSKFTNNYFEKRLKVACTTRNWATMRKLADILEGRGGSG